MRNYICFRILQTRRENQKIGELYGFKILLKTERREKESGKERECRFFVAGEGNIKYTHNNGIIAADPERASLNFLNALQKLPAIIAEEEKKCLSHERDIIVLGEIIESTWNKDQVLSALKTELAAVERKIQLTLDEKDIDVKEPPKEVQESNKSKALKI